MIQALLQACKTNQHSWRALVWLCVLCIVDLALAASHQALAPVAAWAHMHPAGSAETQASVKG